MKLGRRDTDRFSSMASHSGDVPYRRGTTMIWQAYRKRERKEESVGVCVCMREREVEGRSMAVQAFRAKKR